MRRLVNSLLTCLILACPLLCGADEVGHNVQHGHASEKAGNDQAPDQCPKSGDDCVCRGAVQTSSVRSISLDDGFPPPFHFAPADRLLASPHLLHHLTQEGSPTGLASWGDSLTIRAMLQNFRF